MTDPDNHKIDIDLSKISTEHKIIIILLMLMLFMVFYHYSQIDECVEIINNITIQTRNVSFWLTK